ncbi:MAG: outer membrane lipoprotein-sorting protein [Armatimonadia bacterium]|nr:outer membrane lipoprotein-sorting protein [Armatimonadia bacterium]
MLRRLAATCSVIGLVIACAWPAGAATAMEMVEDALRATEQVEDYTATLKVAIEAPNINIPRRTVKVFFKRPDRVHLESNGLAVIPRDALLMGNLATHIKNYATASFVADGEISGRPVKCIKLSPREQRDGKGRVLVWIDKEHSLLLKSEIWRSGKRQLSVRFHHSQVGEYWMPAYIITDVAEGAMGDNRGGAHIQMQFTDYRINTGLSDEIFEDND